MSIANKLFGSGSSTDTGVSRSTQETTSHENIKPEKALATFIAEDPNSKYTFDSERDAPRSELCREGDKLSRKCLMLQMHSTRMFQAMQDQGFFCALPQDPSHTYIACERIPK
ncbi:hypothetical protein BDW22DRAFT_1429943 [Trametopsis cervina]|nr:hypothetical protein BDW22DRAFT_1429943 [Trametopsis cervina]